MCGGGEHGPHRSPPPPSLPPSPYLNGHSISDIKMMMISNKPLFHLETFRFRIPRMLSKEMRNMDITAFLNAEINTDFLPDYTRFDRSKLFFIESEK